MDNINFDTTQNVYLEYQVANLFDRILSSLIDFAILLTYLVTLTLFSIYLLVMDTGIIISVLLLPIAFYDLLLETLWNGQTLGKRIMKIKVTRTDGAEPTFVQFFLRWLLRPIDIWISSGGVATLTVFLNGKGQRLGDLAANTCVVSVKHQIKLSDTILSEATEYYIPEFPETTKLSDRDIQICKDIIKANSYPDISEQVIEGNYKLKNVLENKMGIKSSKQPLDFIKKVINDYTYYNK